MVLKNLEPYPYVFSGEGRCDSPGHNAKYLTYTFLEHSVIKIVAMSVTQFTERGNLNRIEIEWINMVSESFARHGGGQRY